MPWTQSPGFSLSQIQSDNTQFRCIEGHIVLITNTKEERMKWPNAKRLYDLKLIQVKLSQERRQMKHDEVQMTVQQDVSSQFINLITTLLCPSIRKMNQMPTKSSIIESEASKRQIEVKYDSSSHLNQSYSFFQQYVSISEIGNHIAQEIRELVLQRDELFIKVQQLQTKADQDFSDKFRTTPYNSRNSSRRPANKIKRDYHCQVQDCSKAYGTLGSMLQHMRNKHPQYYEKRRQVRRNKKKMDQLSLSEMGLSL